MKFRELYAALSRAKSNINNASVPVIVNGSKDVKLTIERDRIVFTTVVEEEEEEEAKVNDEPDVPAFVPPKPLINGVPGLSAEDIEKLISK